MKPFKQLIRKSIKHSGLYQRLRASVLYDVYWNRVNRTIIDERNAEIAFYHALLTGFQPNDLIFDIGANLGHKTDIFLRLGARVVAVDPDPANYELLRHSFVSYRFKKKPVTIVNKAVSGKNAVQTFWINEPGSAKNTLSNKWVDTLKKDASRFGENFDFTQQRQVSTITLEDLSADYGAPFFVKIDVEGHEPEVLKGLQRPVPYISFEINLPEFKDEGVECIRLLEQLDKEAEFNYSASLSAGLFSAQWLKSPAFLNTFAQCKDSSIEIFCRTAYRRGEA